MMGPDTIKLEGTDLRTLRKLQKLGGEKKFFRMLPLAGSWFVQTISWRTEPRETPPVSFTATLIQVREIVKESY